MSAVKGPKPKHVPLRRCALCRTSFPQQTLLRLSQDESGSYRLGPSRGGKGRGTYVCQACATTTNEKRMRQAFRSQAAQVSALLIELRTATGETNDSGIRTEG